MRTYEQFAAEVKDLLEAKATHKSYNVTGVDGPNQLFDFVHEVAGDGHALGEIIYKVKRYSAKKDPEDLLKVAAWVFLVWRKRDE